MPNEAYTRTRGSELNAEGVQYPWSLHVEQKPEISTNPMATCLSCLLLSTIGFLITHSFQFNFSDLLWTAPEHINISKIEREGFSQKADVYSYGIVLQEMATRSEPFSGSLLQPKG